MAALLISRTSAGLLKSGQNIIFTKVNNVSTGPVTVNKKKWILGTLVGVSGSIFYAIGSVDASDPKAIPAKLPWSHKNLMQGYDHGSMRRGYEVYKQVIDGPDDTGKMFERPGRLTDYIVGPYKNEEEARLANNGALPPDLSLIVQARKYGENYIFHLLTNYTDVPAGIKVGEGQSYNPYFPGGAIGMPQVIFDGLVDFADGTPNSVAQMAKDVVTFLSWCADRSLEERKQIGLVAIPVAITLLLGSWTRFVFKPVKTTTYQFVDRIRKPNY